METNKLHFSHPLSGHTLEIAKIYNTFYNLDDVQSFALSYDVDIDVKPLVG